MTNLPSSNNLLPALQRSATSAFMPIQREFNRLFDELAGGGGITEVAMIPRIDVRDKKNAIEVTVELPGIEQDNVKVNLDDNVLTISGEKRSETDTADGELRVSERSYGAFARSIALPRGVDADKIEATMSQGVLKIVAPKNERSSTKSIDIRGK